MTVAMTKEPGLTDRYNAARLHCDDLEREIESIRMERLLRDLAASGSLIERVRRRTGLALVAAGRAVGGAEVRSLNVFDT